MIEFIKDLFKRLSCARGYECKGILRALPKKSQPDEVIKIKRKPKQKMQAPQSMYDVSHNSDKLEKLKYKSYEYAVNPNKFKK